MILAISSVIPYRKQMHQQPPFGYYLAAMQYFDPLFLATGPLGIQDLLLICRFGIYHHIGMFSYVSFPLRYMNTHCDFT